MGPNYLCEGGDSVFVGEKRGIVSHLEVKVDSLVCEGGELVTEAKLVGAVLGGGEGEAVILLLHLLVEHGAVGVLQTTVHIIMAPGDHLKRSCMRLRTLELVEIIRLIITEHSQCTVFCKSYAVFPRCLIHSTMFFLFCCSFSA